MPEHVCEYGKSIYYKLQINSEPSGSFGSLHVVSANKIDNMGFFLPISPSTFLLFCSTSLALYRSSSSRSNVRAVFPILVLACIFSAVFLFFLTASSYVLCSFTFHPFPDMYFRSTRVYHTDIQL